MSKESSKRSIPMEIRTFFGQQGGRSLMVMGCAGTGKTTFVLQLLEEMADPNRSFYLSTRVSDNALYQQFPWLKDEDMKNRIIDSSRVFLDSLYDDEEDPAVDQEKSATMDGAKDFLQSINEDSLEPPRKVDRTRLSVILKRIQVDPVEPHTVLAYHLQIGQLILDRRLGEYRVPDGWAIFAAGNRQGDPARSALERSDQRPPCPHPDHPFGGAGNSVS